MLTLPGKSIFSPPKPRALPPPPPAPIRSDPGTSVAIADARKKEQVAAKGRRGRRSTIVTGGQGVLGETPLAQPRAGSQVLGG